MWKIIYTETDLIKRRLSGGAIKFLGLKLKYLIKQIRVLEFFEIEDNFSQSSPPHPTS